MQQFKSYEEYLAAKGYRRAPVQRSYDEQALRRGEKVLGGLAA